MLFKICLLKILICNHTYYNFTLVPSLLPFLSSWPHQPFTCWGRLWFPPSPTCLVLPLPRGWFFLVSPKTLPHPFWLTFISFSFFNQSPIHSCCPPSVSFVFVWAPPSYPPLSPSYHGPYKVLQWSLHSFLLQMGLHTDSVSVHRLRLVHPSAWHPSRHTFSSWLTPSLQTTSPPSSRKIFLKILTFSAKTSLSSFFPQYLLGPTDFPPTNLFQRFISIGNLWGTYVTMHTNIVVALFIIVFTAWCRSLSHVTTTVYIYIYIYILYVWWTFCSSRRFIPRTSCPTDIMSPDVMSWDVWSSDVLSLQTFCLRTFFLGTYRGT